MLQTTESQEKTASGSKVKLRLARAGQPQRFPSV